MLKGFAAPRSPLGAAALVPPPPWYFAGDVLAIEFWNDPDVSVDTLPTGVEFEADRTLSRSSRIPMLTTMVRS
jgi:hypothetical protein